MEQHEQLRRPEIKTQELISVIDSIKWEEDYEFSFNGSNFLLLLDTEDESDPEVQGAEYHASTSINGWDIYALETLAGEERRRRLFHEILECNIKDQGFSHEIAHQTAFEEEQKKFGQRGK